MLALVSMSVTACGAFGSGDTGNEPPADAGVTKAADADATTSDGGSPITTPIRCGTITCPATTKCCLPLEGDSPSCIDRTAVCGARFGELLCSGGAGCETGSVCCVSAERNSGQTGFDIVRSYCVTASACPDGNLQHSLCDLGEAAQCPGKACKPYRVDSNGPQSLDVNPTSYATCQ
jgi:hypothetical protein